MRFRYLSILLPLALVVASCGGSSAQLNAGDVVVVGSQHVTKTQFDEAMLQQKLGMKANKQTFPKAGSSAYATLKQQVLGVLVQNAEYKIEGDKLGVAVTDAEINTQLTAIKKQYFGGSEKAYLANIKKQGYTDSSVRDQIRLELLEQKLYTKVTANTNPSSSEIQAYYDAHKSQYKTQESRAVRYILVGKNKQSLAQSLASQLTGAKDATWCTLAKKYSKDPSTASSCGKSTFQKGQTVPEFDAKLFSLATNAVTSVNSAQYGWFVLQPTAAIKPASTETEAEAASTISSQLQTQDRNTQMTNWAAGVTKSFCNGGNIKYQAGYQPVPDPCSQLATATNTLPATTTG